MEQASDMRIRTFIIGTRESRIMPLSKTIVSGVIVLAVVISLSSLAYPSVSVPTFSTETLANASTYISSYTSNYQNPTPTTALVPYSTATSWYFTAYFLCDPASMACPGPPVTTTTTFSEWSTSFYQVTVTSQWSETFTTKYSVSSTHTAFQNVPAYSAIGISDPEFVLLAILIIAAGILGLRVTAKRGVGRPRQAELGQFTKNTCVKCGADLVPNSKFCGKCGSPQ